MRRAWHLLRWALVTEWRMYVGAARMLTRRRDVPDDAVAVPYVGAVSVLLWAFTVVSAVELVALHLVLPWEGVRLAADVLGIWGVVWCLGLTACHYVYPHLATTEGLELRLQRHRPTVVVPWTAVASVRVRERSLESGAALVVDPARVLSFGVAKRTSLDLTLRSPLPVEVKGVTHEVDEVRVNVDDPRRVAELVRGRISGGAVHP